MKKERYFKYTGKGTTSHMRRYFTINRVYKLVRLDIDMDTDIVNWMVVIDDVGDEYTIPSEHFVEVISEEPINLDKRLDELEAEITQIRGDITERDAYKAGDIVVLVSKRPIGWNFNGEMDEFLGRVVKLTSVRKVRIEFVGSKLWGFKPSDIERKATAEEIDAFENTKLPNIGGYEGTDNGNLISYGCKSMQKTTLIRMQGDGVTSFTVGGNPVTEEEFSRIINYIKKTS